MGEFFNSLTVIGKGRLERDVRQLEGAALTAMLEDEGAAVLFFFAHSRNAQTLNGETV